METRPESAICMARSFGGKPALLKVLELDGSAVAVAAHTAHTAPADNRPLWLPINSLFAYSEELFQQLMDAHLSGNRRILTRLWEKAEPLAL